MTICSAQHNFCQECIASLTRYPDAKCPQCRQEIFSEPAANRVAAQIIDEQRVRCVSTVEALHLAQRQRVEADQPAKSYGCAWEGTLEELEKHLKVCQYIEMPCPNKCGVGCLRSDLDVHVAECPERKVSCESCSRQMKWRLLEHHSERCPMKMLDCPYGCGMRVERKSLTVARHYSTCPCYPIDCCFQHLGCNAVMPRGDMDAHHAAAAKLHAELTAARLKELESKCAKLEPELAAERKARQDFEKRARNDDNYATHELHWVLDVAHIASGKGARRLECAKTLLPMVGKFGLSLAVRDNDAKFYIVGDSEINPATVGPSTFIIVDTGKDKFQWHVKEGTEISDDSPYQCGDFLRKDGKDETLVLTRQMLIDAATMNESGDKHVSIVFKMSMEIYKSSSSKSTSVCSGALHW